MYTVNAVHNSHQQWLVAEWLGVGATVTARAREWNFSLFFVCVRCDKHLCLACRQYATSTT